jgi:hypothetical protein
MGVGTQVEACHSAYLPRIHLQHLLEEVTKEVVLLQGLRLLDWFLSVSLSWETWPVKGGGVGGVGVLKHATNDDSFEWNWPAEISQSHLN